MLVARPIEVGTLLAWTFPSDVFPLGAEVAVGGEEVVVFVLDGRVLGVLPPGVHRLDPATIPFLVRCLDPGGTRVRVGIVFVSKSLVFEVSEIAKLRDADGDDVEIRVLSRLRANVVDAGRFALQVMTQGTAGIPAFVSRTFMAHLTRTIGTRSTESRSAIGDVARGVGPDDEADAILAAANSFGGFLEILPDGPFYIDVKGGAAPQSDVYEMLWDCRHCGKKGLLGLTHRFCAHCGAPQDASARYFPSEQLKVAVRNHEYSGADVSCPACRHWNARIANCCTHCGGPLQGGASAGLKADVVVPEGAPAGGAIPGARADGPADAALPLTTPKAATPRKKNAAVAVFVAVLVVLVLGAFGLVCTCIFWKKPGHFQVDARTWERTVEVERFTLVKASTWCSDLPS
ncbi:MAG: hypothetical protein U0169_27745, partial [Polyangiaceae bacterium]